MKLPRLTTHRLMLLVAALTLALGFGVWMKRRAARFDAEASRQLGSWFVSVASRRRATEARAEYHLAMARKYERASSRPWLPVEADPPEPE